MGLQRRSLVRQPNTYMGHKNNHTSGRPGIRRSGTVITPDNGTHRKTHDIMSDKELTEQFNRVERTRADTWTFIAFGVIMGLVAWINS